MRSRKALMLALATLALAVLVGLLSTQADEFTKEDLERWEEEYTAVVAVGRELWTSADLGTNGVSCAQCRPNAANTYPETYPKFQQQIGQVVPLREMINWCLRHPLEGEPLELDSDEMTALEAYVHCERRGVALDPGKH